MKYVAAKKDNLITDRCFMQIKVLDFKRWRLEMPCRFSSGHHFVTCRLGYWDRGETIPFTNRKKASEKLSYRRLYLKSNARPSLPALVYQILSMKPIQTQIHAQTSSCWRRAFWK